MTAASLLRGWRDFDEYDQGGLIHLEILEYLVYSRGCEFVRREASLKWIELVRNTRR
jgi:hypothetical protein